MGLSCDINFELSGGTLKLKSGFNVEVPVDDVTEDKSLFNPKRKFDAGNELELLTTKGLEILDAESFWMFVEKENGLEKTTDAEVMASGAFWLKNEDIFSVVNENFGISLLFLASENKLEETPWPKF